MKNGFVIIDKPEGISSHAAVGRVRRALGAKKAGHTGTLDPMATGVLPVLIERGVKASEYMLTENKSYLATLTLGISTDTEDTTGEVLSRSDVIPNEEEVLAAVNSMLGTSMQTPPMYSAVKQGGVKLYELARRGVTVEREPREISIYKISARKLSDRDYELTVECSKGTYIRTLCADIGKKLGCGGAMKALRRLEAAGFTLDDATPLDKFENMSDAEREALIRPVEEYFSALPKIVLKPPFDRLARNGLEIYLKKIGTSLKLSERVTLYDGGGFFALGEVREYEAGAAIKPIKQFEL